MSGPPKTAIIGAGKIAYTIAAALFRKESAPSIIISKNKYSAESLAYAFESPFYSDKLSDLTADTGIIIIATPDHEIKNIAKQISRLKLPFSKQLYIHLSGAFSSGLLSPLKNKGAHTGSLHIMHSFPNKTPQNIRGMLAAIEHSSPAALKKLRLLCDALELEPFSIKPGMKTYYHTAGVFASNFLIGNLHTAMEAAKVAGIDEALFRRLFLKITEATLTNARNVGIDAALSGPVERNDIVTVKNHIRALKKKYGANEAVVVRSYILQSLLLINVAEMKNSETDYTLLRKFLSNELKKWVVSKI